ncbi:MAG: PTS sugar transporter subunit IIA [Opitutales bacterium]
MNFYEITCENACAASVPARHREDILKAIAKQALHAPSLKPLGEDRIFQALLRREHEGSTGFGNGAAIPHARFDELTDFVLFIVTSRHPIDFEAIDKKKVSVFFVLIGPGSEVKEHLKALAGISTVIARTNVTNELRLAGSGSVLYETFLSKTRDKKPEAHHKNRKLLVVILYEDDLFYDLLEFFIEEGIEGATVIDSIGMGNYISNIPLFSSFVSFMNEDHNSSRTLLATLPEEQVEQVVRGIEDITGDLDKTQGAMLMILDLAFTKGSMKML